MNPSQKHVFQTEENLQKHKENRETFKLLEIRIVVRAPINWSTKYADELLQCYDQLAIPTVNYCAASAKALFGDEVKVERVR